MALADPVSEGRSSSDEGVLKMNQTRSAPRAAPVVQMLMGLRQPARPPKQGQNGRATLDDFDREHLGIAAKE